MKRTVLPVMPGTELIVRNKGSAPVQIFAFGGGLITTVAAAEPAIFVADTTEEYKRWSERSFYIRLLNWLFRKKPPNAIEWKRQ